MENYSLECLKSKKSKSEERSTQSVEELTARQMKIIGQHKLTPHHLKTGFGLHSWSSLQAAIDASLPAEHICKCIKCDALSDDEEEGVGTFRSVSSQATVATSTAPSYGARQQLNYIMGLSEPEEEEASEEEYEKLKKIIDLTKAESDGGLSEAMRLAQKYLREHRIFEFFQFLVAHLLAETPYDPIDFLLNLLDKCLIYRSGIGEPPLLYNKKHINCLFNMMDRMRTGFISFDQYKTGMHTLGIRSYNKNPPFSADRSVPKNYFVEEAFVSLNDLLDDMLRRRRKGSKKKDVKKLPKAPPPSTMG